MTTKILLLNSLSEGDIVKCKEVSLWQCGIQNPNPLVKNTSSGTILILMSKPTKYYHIVGILSSGKRNLTKKISWPSAIDGNIPNTYHDEIGIITFKENYAPFTKEALGILLETPIHLKMSAYECEISKLMEYLPLTTKERSLKYQNSKSVNH